MIDYLGPALLPLMQQLGWFLVAIFVIVSISFVICKTFDIIRDRFDKVPHTIDAIPTIEAIPTLEAGNITIDGKAIDMASVRLIRKTQTLDEEDVSVDINGKIIDGLQLSHITTRTVINIANSQRLLVTTSHYITKKQKEVKPIIEHIEHPKITNAIFELEL